MTFEISLAVATILYLILATLLLYGIRQKRNQRQSEEIPFVSVIVAARNEESNIEACLNSLLNQTYSPSNYHIILVDDYSEDQTIAIAINLCTSSSNLSILRLADGDHRPGKTSALAFGIEHSEGDLILITDADCTVPKTWIHGTVKRYLGEVGIIGGMTLQHASSPFEFMQSLDWGFLLGIAAGAAGLGFPLSTIGNNLSFRRKAYDEVGGYRAVRFSVTEDYALFKSILKTGNWRYRYPLDPELLVMSQPCQSLSELFQQKYRWAKGGLDMTISSFLVMSVGYSMHALIVIVLFINPLACLLGLLLKWCADYFFLSTVLTILRKSFRIFHFLCFELYYHLYVVALPLLLLFGGPVRWKGRSY